MILKALRGLKTSAGVACSLLGTILLMGCASSGSSESAFDDYLTMAPEGSFSAVADEPRLQPFMAMFGPFDRDSIEGHIDSVYAEALYFNDTFHQFSDRGVLKRYFLALVDVAETQVEFLDVSISGNDVLLRWKMNTKSDVLWKHLDINSVGITHLRFNQENKIVLHHDYWDGVEGFYAHLPIIGGTLRSIRGSLGPGEEQ